MAMSLPLARTVICATVALTTVPSNLGSETLWGLTTLTTMGTAVSIAVSAAAAATGAGTWAFAQAARRERERVGAEASFGVVGGDAQRFQKANILRRHGEFRDDAFFRFGFVE